MSWPGPVERVRPDPAGRRESPSLGRRPGPGDGNLIAGGAGAAYRSRSHQWPWLKTGVAVKASRHRIQQWAHARGEELNEELLAASPSLDTFLVGEILTRSAGGRRRSRAGSGASCRRSTPGHPRGRRLRAAPARRRRGHGHLAASAGRFGPEVAIRIAVSATTRATLATTTPRPHVVERSLPISRVWTPAKAYTRKVA